MRVGVKREACVAMAMIRVTLGLMDYVTEEEEKKKS